MTRTAVQPAAPAAMFTCEQALAALNAAVDAVEGIAGDHEAIDRIGSRARTLLAAPGPFTCEDVTIALNEAADDAKEIYNPEGWETSGTIIADSIGDLIANLAAGWLSDPDCDIDEVIARQWHDLDPDLEDFKVWNAHVNDLGDHCPWSGQPVAPNREALTSGLSDDDEGCPKAARAPPGPTPSETPRRTKPPSLPPSRDGSPDGRHKRAQRAQGAVMVLNSKGQLTIPAHLRAKYGLHVGDEVEVGGTLQIVRAEGAESRGQRLVRRLRNTATGQEVAGMSTDQIMALLRGE